MKKGPLVTAVIAGLAMIAVIGAFASNASPYVTVAQAKSSGGDHLHLAGELLKDSIQNDFKKRTLTFRIRDEEGQVITVVHKGDMPPNLADADRVVAVGGMKDGSFASRQLIVKCPSKYEEQGPKKLART
jgi:cytochrome c-type biogenesis protein CcmE